MARQMTQEDRRRIDHLLAVGMTINDIAADLGRNKTTVLHEIIARSVPCDRGYGCTNTLCAKFESCTRSKGYGGNPKRLFRCTPGYFEAGSEFVECICGHLKIDITFSISYVIKSSSSARANASGSPPRCTTAASASATVRCTSASATRTAPRQTGRANCTIAARDPSGRRAGRT